MNSTSIIGAASVLSLEGGGFTTSTPSNLPHLFSSTLSRYRPELELLWVLLSYSPFLVQAYSYTSPQYTRVRRYPYPVLLVHILVAPLYVLRWHARYAALRVWPQPEPTDLLLFAAFWISSASLEVSRVKMGLAIPLMRAGFQVAIAMHGGYFAAGWVGGRDPAAFRATVKFLNWFASFRAVGRLWSRIDRRLVKTPASAYSMTMMTSGCYAMWEAGVPNGVPVFLVATMALVLVKQALAGRIAR